MEFWLCYSHDWNTVHCYTLGFSTDEFPDDFQISDKLYTLSNFFNRGELITWVTWVLEFNEPSLMGVVSFPTNLPYPPKTCFIFS